MDSKGHTNGLLDIARHNLIVYMWRSCNRFSSTKSGAAWVKWTVEATPEKKTLMPCKSGSASRVRIIIGPQGWDISPEWFVDIIVG
jgi:hypothetical protein